MKVNVHEAKTRLSQLLKQVEQGEEIVIARDGVPVAKLISFEQKAKPKRQLGTAKGLVIVPDSFFDPLPKEIEDSFYE